jgi:hypothetical protein
MGAIFSTLDFYLFPKRKHKNLTQRLSPFPEPNYWGITNEKNLPTGAMRNYIVLFKIVKQPRI